MAAVFTNIVYKNYSEIDVGIKALFWVTTLISILPLLLHQLGIDFASHQEMFPFDRVHEMSESAILDAHFLRLSGAFVHTLLECSAFIVAFFTVVLSFTHFSIKRNSVTPIIGMALFMSGCMDAFHTLAADHLIDATSPNTDLIPFTWAICRAFNSAIMIAGVCIVMAHHKPATGRGAGLGLILITSLAFGVAAWTIIHYCATEAVLPQTMFPNNTITRPWDLISLILFLIAGLLVFPLFHKHNPNLFSASIWISVIPQVATQAHMAFGSTELFDHHFNVAHFLKIIAYLVPCTGLLLDYVRTHKHELQMRKIEEMAKIKAVRLNKEISEAHAEALIIARDAEAAKKQAEILASELEHSNQELEQFAYVASHDLKAPLRGINNLAKWIEEDLNGIMGEETKENMNLLRRRVARLESLLNDLLAYSKAGQKDDDSVLVDCKEMLKDIMYLYDDQDLNLKVNIHPDLPTFFTKKSALGLVFRNLINNSIKHHDRTEINLEISVQNNGNYYSFSVKDDGPGIAPEYHERIFEMFKTLRPRDEIEGSGMGLAIIKKLIELQNGKIWIDSQADKRGTNFIFNWKTE
jgi:signal transduction histidine kinase